MADFLLEISSFDHHYSGFTCLLGHAVPDDVATNDPSWKRPLVILHALHILRHFFLVYLLDFCLDVLYLLRSQAESHCFQFLSHFALDILRILTISLFPALSNLLSCRCSCCDGKFMLTMIFIPSLPGVPCQLDFHLGKPGSLFLLNNLLQLICDFLCM